VFVEDNGGWARYKRPELDYAWAEQVATAVGSYNDRDISDSKTLLSAQLPDGERIYVVHPPNCEAGTISVTIRIPSSVHLTHKDLVKRGIYRRVKKSVGQLHEFEEELLRLHTAGEYALFMELAVLSRQNILASGATGSGKTTHANAIVEFVDRDDRIITIEDTREIQLPDHPNHVHLLYESDGKLAGAVTAKDLLRGALRMRPDRIFLAEIRGAEAYDYFVNVCTGHPGSIVTLHAGSVAEARNMLVMRMKESEEGKGFTRDEIIAMTYSTIDVICQFDTERSQEGKQRGISEIYYDPVRKRQLSH
jgi:type IV secretion system protein VirB11